MSRLIYVPQYPSTLRYQEWWFLDFYENLKHYFDEINILGQTTLQSYEDYLPEMFSPIQSSIEFENRQIEEYYELDIREDDILLVNDISFPGNFCSVLYHKRPNDIYAICHATSKNNLDYFQDVRESKFKVESAHAELFNIVFVASDYHKNKLNWSNTCVTTLPQHQHAYYKSNKEYNIINVSRPTPQKVDLELEVKIEIVFEEKIIRKDFDNWKDYYKFISKSKVMFISAKEETFGYQILDAVNNNCIPIAPNNFSYREILPPQFLYNNELEAVEKIGQALDGKMGVPYLYGSTDYLIKNFYKNIANTMLKRSKIIGGKYAI